MALARDIDRAAEFQNSANSGINGRTNEKPVASTGLWIEKVLTSPPFLSIDGVAANGKPVVCCHAGQRNSARSVVRKLRYPMFEKIKRIKDAWDWIDLLWTLLQFFGWSGFVISVATTIWAVVKGVPTPIAIMAGYCTFAGATVLSIVPKAYRVLSKLEQANVAVAIPKREVPDYRMWSAVENVPIFAAAALWCDCDPNASLSPADQAKVRGWITLLMDAVRRGELEIIPRPGTSRDQYEYERVKPKDYNEVTRTKLKAWAKKKGFSPRFLEDNVAHP